MLVGGSQLHYFCTSLRVTVSVVTIKGEECRVMELGQVADATGGDVSTV